MGKTIYDRLEKLTGQRATLDYAGIAKKYEAAIKQARRDDEQKETDYRRGKTSVNDRHIDWMRNVIAGELEKEIDRVDGSLPIVSVFDACQAAKNASKLAPRDIGLSRLATHLEMKWERDRLANLNVSDVLKLKEHYDRNYPKSAAAEVIEKSSRSGYATLPVSELMTLASKIRSQEDYDYQIKLAGLGGNNPYQKKARQFVLALINGEADKQAQQNPSPQYPAAQMQQDDANAQALWEQQGPFGDPNALVDQYEQDRTLVNQYEQDRMQGEDERADEESWQAEAPEEAKAQQLAKQYVDRAQQAQQGGLSVKIDPSLPSISITDESNPDGGYYFQEWQAEELLERLKPELEMFDGQVTMEELLLAQAMDW